MQLPYEYKLSTDTLLLYDFYQVRIITHQGVHNLQNHRSTTIHATCCES